MLRIEDIDPTRCRPEHEAGILEDLAWLGLDWETPVRRLWFRGEARAVTPACELALATTACETGSYEKASKVCAVWGCTASDDKVMDTVRRMGEACRPERLPEACEGAAGRRDTLIIMMDGWMVRCRGSRWGEEGRPPEERVEWKECKSAVMFRLSDVAEVNKGRRTLVTKHVVAMPADTDPVAFGRRVHDEAVRMGLGRAARAYSVHALTDEAYAQIVPCRGQEVDSTRPPAWHCPRPTATSASRRPHQRQPATCPCTDPSRGRSV